jgi:hypothetical protein
VLEMLIRGSMVDTGLLLVSDEKDSNDDRRDDDSTKS